MPVISKGQRVTLSGSIILAAIMLNKLTAYSGMSDALMLAAHIDISQETLSRKLTQLQEMGLIEQTGHKKILIRDRETLKSMAPGME